MMSVDAGLLDANILIYAMDSSPPQHAPSRALLEASRERANAPGATCGWRSRI